MNKSVFRFVLDTARTVSAVNVPIVQGDTERQIKVLFANRGRPYRIASGCGAVFCATTPGGNSIREMALINGNEVIYDIPVRLTLEPGIVECQVLIYKGLALQLAGPKFNLRVSAQVSDAHTDQLATPTINLVDKIVNITPVLHAEKYVLTAVGAGGDISTVSTARTVMDLESWLSAAGTYTINAYAMASGYIDSAKSNTITYSVVRYGLTVNAYQFTSVRVYRNGNRIMPGAGVLVAGENIQIVAEPAIGYKLSTLTFNGTNISSGTIVRVTGDVTIQATSTEKPDIVRYALSRSGEHVNITVLRNGQQVLDGENALIEGEKLTIAAVPDPYFEITRLTVNGFAVQGGSTTLTVSGDVTIAATAAGSEHLAIPELLYTSGSILRISTDDERTNKYEVYDRDILLGTIDAMTGEYTPA